MNLPTRDLRGYVLHQGYFQFPEKNCISKNNELNKLIAGLAMLLKAVFNSKIKKISLFHFTNE